MTSTKYPSLEQIRAAHSWKWEYERYMPLSRFVYRPLGFLLTWLAIRVGLTTEAVSWLSGIVGICGLFCLMGESMEAIWFGIGLLLFFNLMDCVDGSIARTMKTENPYGKFLDSVLGDLVNFAFFGTIGIMVYRHPYVLSLHLPHSIEPVWLAAIGGLTAFCYVMLNHVEQLFEHQIWHTESRTARDYVLDRDSHFKQSTTFYSQEMREPIWKTVLRLVDRNIRVRETQYLFLIIAVLTRAIGIFLLAYFFYFLFHTVASIIMYSRRAKKLRDSQS
jgi:hypothetical protein